MRCGVAIPANPAQHAGRLTERGGAGSGSGCHWALAIVAVAILASTQNASPMEARLRIAGTWVSRTHPPLGDAGTVLQSFDAPSSGGDGSALLPPWEECSILQILQRWFQGAPHNSVTVECTAWGSVRDDSAVG